MGIDRKMVGLPRVTLVLTVGWSVAPLRRVAAPSFGGGIHGRPLRPVFPLRPVPGGGLLVLADLQDGPRARRFLHMAGGRMTWRSVAADSPSVAGWRIVDFLPDGAGGIHLLEFLDHGEDQWRNRVRHVNGAGETIWSRTGAVDPLATDPPQLTGVFTSLQRPAGGPLWVLPRTTTAGLLALDPGTGQVIAVPGLDADISNLLITPAGQALHARMIETRTQVLASTDLATGQVHFGEPSRVPLLNLAGTDDAGRIYARTGDGIARLDPRWEMRVHGAVYDPRTGTITVAYGAEDAGRLIIVQHDPYGIPAATWMVPLDGVGAQAATLVAVEPGPRFILHAGGSTRTTGRLATVTADGTVENVMEPGADTAEELLRRESRVDLTQTAIAANGAVLTPASDAHGYRVLCFHPE